MHIDDQLLTLRPETQLDQPFLEILYRSTRDDLLQLGLPEAMMENLMHMQFNAQFSSYRTQFPDAEFSIVEKGSGPVGYLIVHHGNETSRLVYIALLPDQRNKGHGRCLIETLKNEAATSEKLLQLSVSCMNVPARHLYLSSGFRITGGDGANLEMTWNNLDG